MESVPFTLDRFQTLSQKIYFQVIDFSDIPGAFDGVYNVTLGLSHLWGSKYPPARKPNCEWNSCQLTYLKVLSFFLFFLFFFLPLFLPSSLHFFFPSTSKRRIVFLFILLRKSTNTYSFEKKFRSSHFPTKYFLKGDYSSSRHAEADDFYKYISFQDCLHTPLEVNRTANDAFFCSNVETLFVFEPSLSFKFSSSMFYFVGHGKEYFKHCTSVNSL